MSDKKRNYWPHGIILATFGVLGLSIWTINIASKNPVYMDNAYLTDYRDVDANINELVAKERLFDSRYTIAIEPKRFIVGNNTITITIQEINGTESVNDANITVLITRPDTDVYDKKLKPKSVENGRYVFDQFDIEKLGRWQILTKITLGESAAFKKTEVNATK